MAVLQGQMQRVSYVSNIKRIWNSSHKIHKGNLVFLFEKVHLEVGVEVSSVVSEPRQVLPTPTKTFLEEVPQLHLRLEPQG